MSREWIVNEFTRDEKNDDDDSSNSKGPHEQAFSSNSEFQVHVFVDKLSNKNVFFPLDCTACDLFNWIKKVFDLWDCS